MWGEAAGKIEDIHAMMVTGHRSIKIERHEISMYKPSGQRANEANTANNYSLPRFVA